MNVLIVGSGGREHALAWKLRQSPRVTKLFCAPGNAGVAALAELADIKPTDIDGLLRFAVEKAIDLTVVGMEDPLAQGIVDAFESRGLRIFGPSKAAARIEGSKDFAKRLMRAHGIPTAEYQAFNSFDDAKAYIMTCKYPCVVKADGLAAGKGVIICENYSEALRALERIMLRGSFGAAGDTVVIEEFLSGREVSVLAFCDGKTVVPMQSARDYKRALDGDRGLNTGGMGCVSPCEYYTDDIHRYCVERIFEPTLKAMAAEGAPFKGVLYFGLMITDEGAKVLEYNARFGDPETQVVLPRLKTDLLDIIEACVDGALADVNIEWSEEAAVCVILASGGYPGAYETGHEITGLNGVGDRAVVFQAGTALKDGKICTSGGRVLGVTALGKDYRSASAKAYTALADIRFRGMFFRKDIGGAAEDKQEYPIRRLFVEKKQPFDVEARLLLRDLRDSLSVELDNVRVLNRYDVSNMSDDLYEQAKNQIFSEPMVDAAYDEALPMKDGGFAFAVEYLPGQYNQRADSAEQAVRIISGKEGVCVAAAKVFVLYGPLSDDDIERVKRYCVNPVDSREACETKPDRLGLDTTTAAPVQTLDGFTGLDSNGVDELRVKLGLAMSLADMECVQAHFRRERRQPTITELRCLDTYWSDHCRHTTFLTDIDTIVVDDGTFAQPIAEAYGEYMSARAKLYGGQEKEITLMDIATIGMKLLRRQGLLADLDESEEINACSIKVDIDVDGQSQPWLVMFKNETHNHPTEIEPFGGAATCLGGAIRDPLSGRAYVYQAMRLTGSGDPRASAANTLPGKLSQHKITTEAARGFSSYGNQIGLATGHVAEVYHEGFVAKRMEIGAVVGAAPAGNVRREKPAPGDYVILVGGRTGRDGCGGATGSSKEHTEESILTCGAEVQKGNPITERKIQRLFRNPAASRLIKRCNDFGAGGVCVAVGELAEGLDINLDLVPKKYDGLDGTELAISESQERMAVVVSCDDADGFMGLCAGENLEAIIIAQVTDSGRLRMFWRGVEIVDLSREFLDTNGARQRAAAHVCAPGERDYFTEASEKLGLNADWKSGWLNVMGRLNVCSQKGLVERFDSSIGTGTVLMPFGGDTARTPAEAAVSKLPVLEGETNAATIMAHGYDPDLSSWSPFHGAVYAVVEALAKVTACGGDYTKARMSFQEYFEKLGDDEEKWGKPLAGLLGALHAQTALNVPAIGGKDSMSGTFKDLNVPPVVAAFALCVADAGHVISPEFKLAGSHVIHVPLPRDERAMPDFQTLRDNYAAIHKLITEGKVLAAHTVRGHGLSEALSKMCFGNNIGVALAGEAVFEGLFAPGYGSVILEIRAEENPEALLSGLRFTPIGTTTQEPAITLAGETLPLADVFEAWRDTLEHVFPSEPAEQPETVPLPLCGRPHGGRPSAILSKGITFARPRVFIPVFPGTNCEDDSRAAFERAGAVVDEFVFKNLTGDDIARSLERMTAAVEACQILMLPGGFSAGDEPDGSAKFITAVFRNPRLREAVMELINKRDGLVLGICNGFQALIKLGLLEHGAITETNAGSPTLSYNTIGRHQSSMARTTVVCNRSPWLAGVKEGDEHVVPVSHGEGRFVASDAVFRKLSQGCQIATVYSGTNPNGSAYNIEGVTSPCGRVFGKMCHSERVAPGIYKNIAGNKDQKLFESGVRYFS